MTRTDRYYQACRGLIHGDAARRVGWDSDANQQAGFLGLLSLVDLRGLSVHDAGCGVGDFVPLALGAGAAGYVGTDCLGESIAEARTRHPGVEFRRLDLLTDPLPEADVTVLHGTLAYLRAHEVETMLDRCWAASRRAIAFRSWWGLTPAHPMHRENRAVERAIGGFLRRAAPAPLRRSRIGDYGIPTEAAFVVWRDRPGDASLNAAGGLRATIGPSDGSPRSTPVSHRRDETHDFP